MGSYLILVVLMCLSAAFAYINHRFIKMPFAIGLFFLSTIMSLFILTFKGWDVVQFEEIKTALRAIDLSKFILDVMLGFLLFAGSLHTEWEDIKPQLKPIGLFAVGGVILSTVIIAALMYWVVGYLDLPVSFLHCLIFGALISPTDPIAVLGILTKANVSKKIESTIVGESLFNDGIGVVIFIALLETLRLGTHFDFGHFGVLFLEEAVGGLIFGLVFGFALHRLMRSIDNYEAEVLLTLAFVMGGYSLCSFLHISGALAMVIMGLLVGNYRQERAMSDTTIEYIHKFWELVDIVLNAILFISIAFVILFIDFSIIEVIVGVTAVAIVLFSRTLVVMLPNYFLSKWTNFSFNESKIIVWGGLRGGLSIALVLSLPDSPAKQVLLISTYMCVVFSILAQGLSIGKLAQKWQEV